MPHIAPIPVLPTAVVPATPQKTNAHNKETAQGSEFSQLFREHVAPQLEIGEAPLSAKSQTAAGSSPATKKAISKRVLTEKQPFSESSISSTPLQSKSLVQLHAAASTNSTKKETLAAGSPVADATSRPPGECEAGRTVSASSSKAPKPKRVQVAAQAAETTPPASCSPLAIPQSVHAAAPLVISSIAPERVHSPSSSVEGHLQPSKTQFVSTPGAQTAVDSKNELRDETPSIPDPASALGPSLREGQTAPGGGGVDFSREAAPAPANRVASKEAQEPQTPGRNSATPPAGYVSPERNSKELNAPVAASANGSHPVQIQSPLSPAQPTNQAPALITPPPASVSSTPNLYDKMDQGVSPAVLHSGAEHVVVGVHDPNLGWLEIKTQNVAGHVDATLVTASGQAHASLAGQLPSIAEYLQQRDLRIGTLAVQHHMPGANGGGGPGNGSANSGTGTQNSNHSGSGHREEAVTPLPARDKRPLEPAPLSAGEDHPTFQPVSYISVRA